MTWSIQNVYNSMLQLHSLHLFHPPHFLTKFIHNPLGSYLADLLHESLTSPVTHIQPGLTNCLTNPTYPHHRPPWPSSLVHLDRHQDSVWSQNIEGPTVHESLHCFVEFHCGPPDQSGPQCSLFPALSSSPSLGLFRWYIEVRWSLLEPSIVLYYNLNTTHSYCIRDAVV